MMLVETVETIVTGSQVSPAAVTKHSCLAAAEQLAAVEEHAAGRSLLQLSSLLLWRTLQLWRTLLMRGSKLLWWYHHRRRHQGRLVQLILLKQLDDFVLEGIPPWIRNGQHLGREPQTEGLPGVCPNIEDVGDCVPNVLGFCHGVHHHHDGLVHWCQGPGALLGTAVQS